MKFPYGKYQNRKISDIFCEDRKYIIWWYETVDIKEIKEEIHRLLFKDFKEDTEEYWDNILDCYDWNLLNGD